MTLKEMIFKRKSCRSFTNIPVDAATIETIKAFPMKPLYPDIKVHWDIVPRNQVKCICPWTTPQLITIYSEEAEGYLENIGFLFQQMDLYLQTLGLGVCWLGMGRMNPKTTAAVEGMKFVIMLAFGQPKGDQLRRDLKNFKRKPMDQITDNKRPDSGWLDEIGVQDAMDRLGERERHILKLRFYQGRTQMEVAGEIGISQAQVSRLEKNALVHMRRNMGF